MKKLNIGETVKEEGLFLTVDETAILKDVLELVEEDDCNPQENELVDSINNIS